MTNRKKRLKKGIKSIEEQIELHKEKEKKAKEEGREELTRYYFKEIEAKKKYLEIKKQLLEKQ